VPSNYNRMLELVARPFVSVRSSVSTSPLECGSIRTVRVLGCVSPAKVDRAAFSFQVPNAASAAQQVIAATVISATIRMWLPCAARIEITRAEWVGIGCNTLARD
jgi:hypothetical protein